LALRQWANHRPEAFDTNLVFFLSTASLSATGLISVLVGDMCRDCKTNDITSLNTGPPSAPPQCIPCGFCIVTLMTYAGLSAGAKPIKEAV